MEIELYSKLQDPIGAIERAGQWFAASGMFGCERKEQGMILAMVCFAEKKSPFEIKRTYHLLNGELSMRADAMLAQFRNKGGKHKVISRTAERAAVELEKDGDKQLFSFTWDEAKLEPFIHGKEGLKKNWRTPRARMQMLWARVISDGVRTLAPEIVAGVYTPEESDDNGAGPATPPATVFPEQASTAVSSPAPAAAPIDVQSSPATPTPQPPAASQSTLSDPGKLTPETVRALQSAIGEANAGASLAWLKAQGWIKNDFSELSQKRAQKILRNPTGFIETVNKGAQ